MTKRFDGHFYPEETYGDNSEYLLKNPSVHSRSNLSLNRIEKELEFHKTFPPGTKHSRLVGHIVKVYLLENPIAWVKRGRLLVPYGNSHEIYSIDLGKELKNRTDLKDDPYLDIVCNYSEDNTSFDYSFNIKKTDTPKDKPKKFVITPYNLIDDQFDTDKTEIGRTSLKSGEDSKTNPKLTNLYYSRS